MDEVMMLEAERMVSDGELDMQWVAALDYAFRMGMLASHTLNVERETISHLSHAWMRYLQQWDSTCRKELGSIYRIGYDEVRTKYRELTAA